MPQKPLLFDQNGVRMRETRHGILMYPWKDTYVGKSLDKYGEYCYAEAEMFRMLVKPGHVVVEVGANIGAHTIQLSKLVGPEGRVLAIEPQEYLFCMLCGNLALNHVRNVRLMNVGCGQRSGFFFIPPLDYHEEINFGGVEMETTGPGTPTTILTLDSLNLKHVDLLKVDVEGMEEAVIRGSLDTIRRDKPLMIVENDRPESSKSLLGLLLKLGYELYWFCPPLFHEENFYEDPENLWVNIVSANVLCIPPGRHQVGGLARILSPKSWFQTDVKLAGQA